MIKYSGSLVHEHKVPLVKLKHDLHFWKWDAKQELGVEENLGVPIEKKIKNNFFALYFENFQFDLEGGILHQNEKFFKIDPH